MMTLRSFWHNLTHFSRSRRTGTAASPVPTLPIEQLVFDLAADDPLARYAQTHPGVLDMTTLHLPSPALEHLRRTGVSLVAPLISQGELIGLISLGGRLSEQGYSSDDHKLLADLTAQLGPAVRLAQLVQEQRAEARTLERLEGELRIARGVQQTLLPQATPTLPGWQLAAYWQPARTIGGDFYDFFHLPDGRLGVIIGDVTGKGIPAALVMAATRSILIASAERLVTPGAVLARVNNFLCQKIPTRTFVTCFYTLLDPATGRLCFANAGHPLPYRRQTQGVDPLDATGLPLGLLPDFTYVEQEVVVQPGDTVLFYSDGLVEAHNAERKMFSFRRLQEALATHPDSEGLIEFLLTHLAAFTGAGWEQEDDITLVTLARTAE